jgi:uncharacterized protein (TIGR02246 family)
MSARSNEDEVASASEEAPVMALYRRLLDAWNARDASAYAACFEDEGHVIGFDGSTMDGRAQIDSTLRQIFADHVTAAYVAKVRGVELLGPDVAVLRAAVGMVPPGGSDINPAVNALQTMVAARRDGAWRSVLFQNTPAQFHGRPEAAAALTEELRALL